MFQSMDSYSREVQACRWCCYPQWAHEEPHGCIGPRGQWEGPQNWLLLARMRVRRTDPLRWIPCGDERVYGRKWTA